MRALPDAVVGTPGAVLRSTVRGVLRLVPPARRDDLDVDLARVGRVFAAAGQHRLGVAALRVAYLADSGSWHAPSPSGITTRDEDLSLPADPSGPRRHVRVRTYTPAHHTGGELVYVHGGGFAIGSVQTHDSVCRRVAAGAGVVVRSVEYRLAPEHPFPAGLTDVCSAWAQLHARYVAAGGDPARIGIGGDSAGGHAGATVADEAVDPTLGVEVPVPGFCWLVYPETDFAACVGMTDDAQRDVLLSAAMVRRFSAWHVADPAQHAAPALNPLHRPQDVLARHPRTWIQTVGFDPLREQGEAYARALAAAGVDVAHDHDPTVAHGYVSMTGVSAGAAAALDRGVAALRRFVAP